MYHPVVIVHRDPDSSNEFETFGEIEVIDFDYGAVDLRSEDEFREWATSHLEEARLVRIRCGDEVADRIITIVADTASNYDHPVPAITYDQLADRDDLIVAKEELQTLYDYQQTRNDDENAQDLHGLDTAITVLGKLIERLPHE
jgi:hypothetical protein